LGLIVAVSSLLLHPDEVEDVELCGSNGHHRRANKLTTIVL
jgi:hypothetical protein